MNFLLKPTAIPTVNQLKGYGQIKQLIETHKTLYLLIHAEMQYFIHFQIQKKFAQFNR